METELSESQQEKVFRVMEICNMEAPEAVTLLRRFNFDVENAIQTQLNGGGGPAPAARVVNPQPFFIPPEEPEVNFGGYASDEDEEDEEYVRYCNYKNSGMNFEKKYNVHRSFSQKIKGFLPSFLRNETPGGEQFVNRLADVFGKNANKLKLQRGTFLDNAEEISKNRFPLLVFFVNFAEPTKKILLKLISDQSWTDHVNTCFRVVGFDTRSYEFEPELVRLINPATDVPCIALFRIDIWDELHLMDRVPIQPDMNLAQTRRKLGISKSMCIRAQMNEGVFEKKYYGLITGTYVKPQMTFQQSLRLREERKLRQQQEEEFRRGKQLHVQKKKQEKIEVNKEKELADKGQKAAIKRKQQREAMRQYSSGVSFKFRLPDGSSSIVTADPKETVQYLFTFVNSLEEGGFESDPDRKFEIIRPYDRLVLSENRSKTIAEVFGQEGAENLVINQQ